MCAILSGIAQASRAYSSDLAQPISVISNVSKPSFFGTVSASIRRVGGARACIATSLINVAVL